MSRRRVICLTTRLRAEYLRQMRLRDKRQSLIVEHIPQVEKIARSLRHLFPQQIPFQDLVQSGCVGLVEAAGRYEPGQGSFERYCYRRVRGAIIDAHKRQAYREENHDSIQAIQERNGYLPAELQVDNHSPRPDETALRRERLKLVYERIERLLPDDERDLIKEALRGVRPIDSAAARNRPLPWVRAKLASAKAKVLLPKAA